jgi:RHS repeat-associated protein
VVKVTKASGLVVTMTYNTQGQRLSYTANGGGANLSESFLYRGGELAQVTTSGTQNTTDTYVYRRDGTPLELIRTQSGATSRYWYEVDGRGNVIALTDVTGNTVDRYSYNLWGKVISTTESVPQRLRYTGSWYDQELSWYWLTTRSYDPTLERFLQPDPSQQEGIFTYAYVGDDPADESDTTGLNNCSSVMGMNVCYSDQGKWLYTDYGASGLASKGAALSVTDWNQLSLELYNSSNGTPVPGPVPTPGPGGVADPTGTPTASDSWLGMPTASDHLSNVSAGRSCNGNYYELSATMTFNDPGWINWTQAAHLWTTGYSICSYWADPIQVHPFTNPVLTYGNNGCNGPVTVQGNQRAVYPCQLVVQASGSVAFSLGAGFFSASASLAVKWEFDVRWKFTPTTILGGVTDEQF